MVERVNLSDSDVTNDTLDHGSGVGPVGVESHADGYGINGSVSVGGVDVLRFDPSKDIPGLSGLPGAVTAGTKWAQGDSDWAELFNIAGSAGDLAANAVVYAMDPLNWLISAGLSFLVDVVQPLEDLLGLVTGNAERMEGEIAKWDRVAAALVPLAEEIRKSAAEGLIGWQGLAADAAKTRLTDFAEAVAALANDVKKVVMILNIAKMVMEALQAIVIGIIATLIEWMIYTWTAALATAGPTMGASTAAAGAATTAQGAAAMGRASSFISRGVMILKRLRLAMFRMHPTTMRRVQMSFQPRIGGRIATGWVGWDQALKASVTDWRAWAGTVDKILATGANEGKRFVDHSRGDSMPDDEMERKLDPNQ